MLKITPDSPIRRIGSTEFPKEYQAYRGMINRCYRPATKRYECYGGRGITVCDRWRFGEGRKTGFRCFIEDMGNAPTSDHSLDRINVNGNYEPNNCHWIPMAEQSRNRRTNRWLTGFGKTQIMQDWADEYGIPRPLFYRRIVQMGMSVEEAVKSHSHVKLSLEKARQIRRLHEEDGLGRYRIAKIFGVSDSCIQFVLSGQTWKEPSA